MDERNIRVLVVDDSAVMRTLLTDRIGSTPGMSVVGIARNGREAGAANAALQPDVISLDLQMPEMDGLATIDAVLDRGPVRIIMVSSLTKAGAGVTLDALERGAVDYVAKPAIGTRDTTAFLAELIHKIRMSIGIDIERLVARRKRRPIAGRRATMPAPPLSKAPPEACPEDLARCCVALGISTGGPPALSTLLEMIRPPMPPMVIVQHMPPQFTGPLAARLDSISLLSVKEAEHGDKLRPNSVLLAPGGKHIELRGRATHVSAILHENPPVSGHRPSVDVMMQSAAKVFGPLCLGVIMTGMGRDGADGCRAIRAAGGFVLGQDQTTSDVYGMNRVAFVEGNVDRQFGLGEAAAVIAHQIRQMASAAVSSSASASSGVLP